MKRILLLAALCFSAQAFAQTRSDVKIYGYLQHVTGGANPTEAPNESGVEKPVTAAGGKNYHIYIAGPKGQRIYPMEIWVEGHQYSTRTVKMASPVLISIQTGATNPSKVTLVPKLSKDVFQVTLSSAAPAKTLAVAMQLADKKDVVISYKLGGKMYYAVLDKLSVLESAAMQ